MREVILVKKDSSVTNVETYLQQGNRLNTTKGSITDNTISFVTIVIKASTANPFSSNIHSLIQEPSLMNVTNVEESFPIEAHFGCIKRGMRILNRMSASFAKSPFRTAHIWLCISDDIQVKSRIGVDSAHTAQWVPQISRAIWKITSINCHSDVHNATSHSNWKQTLWNIAIRRIMAF